MFIELFIFHTIKIIYIDIYETYPLFLESYFNVRNTYQYNTNVSLFRRLQRKFISKENYYHSESNQSNFLLYVNKDVYDKFFKSIFTSDNLGTSENIIFSEFLKLNNITLKNQIYRLKLFG